jgi:hypothetical protein
VIKCKYALCAQKVIRDADLNTVSAISFMEELNLGAVPGILPSLEALFVFVREAQDNANPNVVLRFTQGGKTLHELPISVDFQGNLITRAIIRLGNFPITAMGVLRVEAVLTGSNETLGFWEISVNPVAPAARATNA